MDIVEHVETVSLKHLRYYLDIELVCMFFALVKMSRLVISHWYVDDFHRPLSSERFVESKYNSQMKGLIREMVVVGDRNEL